MTSDLEIYRSAKLLIDRHGDNAVIEATMMADKMLEAGDLDGLPPLLGPVSMLVRGWFKERPNPAGAAVYDDS